MAVLAAARTPATAEPFARDEGWLVERARELRYELFVRVLAYWGQLADPDGCDGDAEAQHQAGASTCRKPSAAAGCSTACSIR